MAVLGLRVISLFALFRMSGCVSIYGSVLSLLARQAYLLSHAYSWGLSFSLCPAEERLTPPDRTLPREFFSVQVLSPRSGCGCGRRGTDLDGQHSEKTFSQWKNGKAISPTFNIYPKILDSALHTLAIEISSKTYWYDHIELSADIVSISYILCCRVAVKKKESGADVRQKFWKAL